MSNRERAERERARNKNLVQYMAAQLVFNILLNTYQTLHLQRLCVFYFENKYLFKLEITV